jgi:hypothetical protein
MSKCVQDDLRVGDVLSNKIEFPHEVAIIVKTPVVDQKISVHVGGRLNPKP